MRAATRSPATLRAVAAAALVTARLGGEPVARLSVAFAGGTPQPFSVSAAEEAQAEEYLAAVGEALGALEVSDGDDVPVRLDGALGAPEASSGDDVPVRLDGALGAPEASSGDDVPVRLDGALGAPEASSGDAVSVRLDGAAEALGDDVVVHAGATGFRVDAPEPVAGSLTRMLERAAEGLAARTGPLGAIDLVGAQWRAEILALGRSPAPAPPVDTLGSRFAAVAARVPDRVAVTDGTTAWTYAQLDARAAEVAQRLRENGVRPGDRVGLCAGRSAHTVAGMIACVRAGATYVPMDPGYPAERLEFLVSDAELGVVLATAEHAASVPPGRRVVLLDEDAAAPMTSAPDAADPEVPAYVIYTSGSSGTPKGVPVRHRNVLSLLAATEGRFALGPDDVWSWFHSESFDFSVWEIWGCLLTGGRLVVVPPMTCRDPADFLRLLEGEVVTVLSQTPSAFAPLLDLDRADLDRVRVRLLVFGGEGLDPRMLAPWFEVRPPERCRTVNMFGITETTVHVTAQEVDRAMVADGSSCVGPPLPGWSVRVVDSRQRVLPPGVAGEIVVGGAGVAVGYLGRAELTAQRFGIDDDGTPLYASGDRGRLRADGRLEHLGRIDGQIKLRGYRIEPEEIRAVLLQEPSVAAAAVLLLPGPEGDAATATLQAFVVPAAGEDPPDGVALRAAAARTLPAHMVPSAVTVVEALPLTVNGKLDQRALAALMAAPDVAVPRSPAEKALFTAWTEVFGVEPDLDANFFDAGGTSLAAVKLVTALGESGHEVAVRQIYRSPTMRDLASALDPDPAVVS